MLLRESHLTFGRIADKWARELEEAKTPDRRNRDEIFLEMVRDIRRGQFDDKGITLARSARDVYSEILKDQDSGNVGHFLNVRPPPMPVTRETLDEVVQVRQGAGQRYPGTSRLEFLTSLKLEDYDPLFLSAYLEPLTISKEDFGRWCDEQGHQRPRFWFSEQADAKKLRKAGRKRGSSPFEKKDALLIDEMEKLCGSGTVTSVLAAAKRVVKDAPGGGTPESRMKRLCRRHKERYGDKKAQQISVN